MIRIVDLEKTFQIDGQSFPILQIPEWNVEKGEQIALLGPSGSGKSTLLHIIGGVLTADKGEVAVANQPVSKMNESERDTFRAKYIGYIFQDFHLIPSLTAKQNVELVLSMSIQRKEREDLIRSWFHRVGLTERMNHLPSQLSRGQQQRVAIIRALIGSPPVILADEPTGSLDWETAGKIMELLLEICVQENLTLITVTHDLHLSGLFPKSVHIAELDKRQSVSKSGRAAG